MEAETGVMLLQAKGRSERPKLEKAKTDSPLEPLEGDGPTTPEFQTRGLQKPERIDFCCFKSLSLQYFVLATGSSCKPIGGQGKGCGC